MSSDTKSSRRNQNTPFILLECALCILVTFVLSTFLLSTLIPSSSSSVLLAAVLPTFVNSMPKHCPNYGCITSPNENQTIVLATGELSSSSLDTTTRMTSSTTTNTSFLFNSSCQLGCLFTRKGPSHTINQDRSFLIRPFHTNQDFDSFLVGVLDGHGIEGHHVAEYVHNELPRILANKLNTRDCCVNDDEWIIQQIKDTFSELQQQIPMEIGQRGGCTATVTLRIGTKLFFANVGDSRTILAQSLSRNSIPTTNVLYHTRFDKPHLPDERERIEKLGGRIHIPVKNAALSRVIVHSKIANDTIGLAMSRSLGDVEWKEIGVIAEPIIDVVSMESIKEEHAFIMAASDGLWDLRKMEVLAHRFAQDMKAIEKEMSLPVTLSTFIEKISPKKGYRDDISVVVVPL